MNFFEIYFPIAGVSANLLALVVAGFFTGVIAALFGLGGGFIVVPYLTMVGVPINVAIATSINQMTAATLSSFLTYTHLKRVDYKMGYLLLCGGIIGIIVGQQILTLLIKSGQLEMITTMIFIIVLFLVSIFVTRDAIKMYLYSRRETGNIFVENTCYFCKFLPFKTVFKSSSQEISIIMICGIGFIGGFLVTLLGIAGGFIMIPLMLYGLKIHEKFIAGTIHFQIFFTSIISTLIHSLALQSLDILLSVYLMVGTAIGAKIGAIISMKLNANHYRFLLAIVMIILCAGMINNIIASPHDTYQVTEEGK